jgi:hypothetical protein
MQKIFQTLDGEPVATTSGTLVVLPMGEADIQRVAGGYAIEVIGTDPVVVPVGEFERLLSEGQLHGIAA